MTALSLFFCRITFPLSEFVNLMSDLRLVVLIDRLKLGAASPFTLQLIRPFDALHSDQWRLVTFEVIAAEDGNGCLKGCGGPGGILPLPFIPGTQEVLWKCCSRSASVCPADYILEWPFFFQHRELRLADFHASRRSFYGLASVVQSPEYF